MTHSQMCYHIIKICCRLSIHKSKIKEAQIFDFRLTSNTILIPLNLKVRICMIRTLTSSKQALNSQRSLIGSLFIAPPITFIVANAVVNFILSMLLRTHSQSFSDLATRL
jgi:hypothetical protein